MNKTVMGHTLRIVAFLLCAILLFAAISSVLERKTYSGAWNYMAKLNEFYSLEKDSLDYICVGSSHAYCTVNPLEVWNRSGLSGFVLATQQQPLMASYHYIKEAFKTQSPEYVVLEGYMIGGGEQYSDAVLYDAIDPLRFSFNKLEMICNLVEYEKRPEYVFNILKYHTRWKDGVEIVHPNKTDFYKGFVALSGDFSGRNVIPDYDNTEETAISDFNRETLDRIYDLVEKNGAKLVLMIAPYDGEDAKLRALVKAEKKWAEEKGALVLDYALLLDELKIDPEQDYVDSGHLDVSGAAKISAHFSDFLIDQGIKPRSLSDEAKWKKDYEAYLSAFQEDLAG